MFARVAAVASVLALPILAAAEGSCSTGPIQCCNSVDSASSNVVSAILGVLGLILDPDVQVGTQCSPISVIGAGVGACSATPVCCENNNVGGLISIGCVPVIL
ncbi:fungal hydrophobin-domain-containing protein [Trametes elegans]|nr:fungal hydrophobin-domain-containing protein [Trametes elegans]